MNTDSFAAWAAAHGLSVPHAEKIAAAAATEQAMKDANDAMEPAPPVYSLDDIVRMTDGDPYGIRPSANGFILIGGCPNGDPIAIDVADEVGSVWYVNHESMHGAPRLRDVAVRIAADATEFMAQFGDGEFPFDYDEAAG